MDPGGYNHPIRIERRVQVGLLEMGDPDYRWQEWKTAFAKAMSRRGKEYFDSASNQRFAQEVYQFSVHRLDVIGINAAMRIVDADDQAYDIKALLPDMEYRDTILIECTLQDGRIGDEPLLCYIDEAVPSGSAGYAYAGFSLKAKGGIAPITFSVATGALPAGLSLNSGTGAVTGTPTAAGTATVAFRATDAAGEAHTLPAISLVIAA